MANKLADARRSLIRAKESARKRLEELENESREIKASIKSLEAALKALGRSNRPKTSRRPADQAAAAAEDELHYEVEHESARGPRTVQFNAENPDT